LPRLTGAPEKPEKLRLIGDPVVLPRKRRGRGE
jgi:hypothetical protein